MFSEEADLLRPYFILILTVLDGGLAFAYVLVFRRSKQKLGLIWCAAAGTVLTSLWTLVTLSFPTYDDGLNGYQATGISGPIDCCAHLLLVLSTFAELRKQITGKNAFSFLEWR
jgi:hypothetical protein